MTNTISQLWNGNLEPIRFLGKNNTELKQLEKLMQDNLKKIEENLDDKQKEVFEKYNSCIDEYLVVLSEQAFCDGFCLGTKIFTEAISGAEQVL